MLKYVACSLLVGSQIDALISRIACAQEHVYIAFNAQVLIFCVNRSNIPLYHILILFNCYSKHTIHKKLDKPVHSIDNPHLERLEIKASRY